MSSFAETLQNPERKVDTVADARMKRTSDLNGLINKSEPRMVAFHSSSKRLRPEISPGGAINPKRI
jgi:hypothetical protein